MARAPRRSSRCRRGAPRRRSSADTKRAAAPLERPPSYSGSAEPPRLFRRDHHQHLATFGTWMRLDLRDFRRQFGDALKHIEAKLGVAHLAAAETHGHLDLVAFAKEVEDLFHLHVEIMIVDVRTHLALFDFLGLLALAGEVGLFLRLIFELDRKSTR